MGKLLVVEDSKFFSSIVKHKIENELGLSVVVVETMKAAKLVLDTRKEDFFIALLDLTLPDASGVEIVKTVKDYGLPCIVFSSNFSEELQHNINELNVVDYIIKDNPSSFDYLVSLVNRFHNNASINVVIAEDSKIQRQMAAHFLKRFNLNVIEAENGDEALKIVTDASKSKTTKISLVITDYEMPKMNGFDLIVNLRKKWNQNELGIIGFSAADDKRLPSKFLKIGADDFVHKPIQPEEFISRISHNLNNLEQINKLHIAATRDYMTGMYNRRFFFKTAISAYEKACKDGVSILVSMIDVDFFKKVNDTHGHHVGDEVLIKVAQVLETEAREQDLIARFGGEEFCLFSVGMDPEVVGNYLNHLRQKISELEFESSTGKFQVTASLGACTKKGLDSIDDMINEADERLYDAKEGGRNKVVLSR
ncbi:diguanylate cyclase [Curvivirga sp.]|uniref:GGDEF domain-containing response regulator n=1 Tax=Curvivirga sp. TaxID=2856848 RepID=UPI003B5ACA68